MHRFHEKATPWPSRSVFLSISSADSGRCVRSKCSTMTRKLNELYGLSSSAVAVDVAAYAVYRLIPMKGRNVQDILNCCRRHERHAEDICRRRKPSKIAASEIALLIPNPDTDHRSIAIELR